MKQASLNAKLSGFLQDKVISKIYLSFQQLLNKNIGTKNLLYVFLVGPIVLHLPSVQNYIPNIQRIKFFI